MYGMNMRDVLDERIDVFRLSLASAPKTVKWVTKDAAKGREGGMFPMVLVGDAAMQHNLYVSLLSYRASADSIAGLVEVRIRVSWARGHLPQMCFDRSKFPTSEV